MAKKKTNFVCNQCGSSYAKWAGRCIDCGAWDSIQEFKIYSSSVGGRIDEELIKFSDLLSIDHKVTRYFTDIGEFDRVCGGGIVPGSAILVGGEPGIGKSTLLMQIVAKLSSKYYCIYVSGEESLSQLSGRALRLGISDGGMNVANNNSLNAILNSVSNHGTCQVLVIDSIQTVSLEEVSGLPGSISQVKACSTALINFCKQQNILLIIVGHVTKDGNLAGPKMLEHMVDTVLYFEGEKNYDFRILRAVKNRFGPSDEIGVFEMTDQGLLCVDNPSALFLHDYGSIVSGSAVFASMEGTRPLLVEVQSLLVQTVFSAPRRAVVGCDMNRLSMLLAVLEARVGVALSNRDVYVNIAGGIKVTEPALDLAICASLLSIFFEVPIANDTLFFGEISLSGHIKPTAYFQQRLYEGYRLGFKRAIIPKSTAVKKQASDITKNTYKGMNIHHIENVKDLISYIKGIKS